jgi:hypothetical protein
MVLGYFEEEKVYDFIVVGGSYESVFDARACTEDIQVERQEIASQAVWQKTPASRSLSLRLAPSLSFTQINPIKPNMRF